MEFKNVKNLSHVQDAEDSIENEENEIKATLEELAKSDNILQTIFETAFGVEKEPTEYVVKKIFNGSNKVTTLETFNSKKEAEEFIKDILKNMPELSQTCTFVIEHQVK